MSDQVVLAPPVPGRRDGARLAVRQVVGPQLLVLAGQGAAGLGNLVFSVLLARLLVPDAYAHVTSFLALTLFVQLPATALTAVVTMDRRRGPALRALALRSGLAVGALVVALSGVLGRLLSLPWPLVAAVGVLTPALLLVAVDRGTLFGAGDDRAVARSLLSEPLGRLVAGTLLALVAGSVGAAAGVVLAGFLTVAVTAAPALRAGPTGQASGTPTGAPWAAASAFLLFAVLQVQALLVANRHLDGTAAGAFGVLSTLGGAAVFATATVPLVLMSALARGQRGARSAALVITAAVGLGIAAAGAVVAPLLVSGVFGDGYAPVTHLVGPYLLAMALLGVSRVVVAARCAASDARLPLTVLGVGAAVQLVGLLTVGNTPGQLVAVTLAVLASISLVLAGAEVGTTARGQEWLAVARSVAARRSTWAMVGLCAVALVLRLVAMRGIWVDEAISVAQARMSLGDMLRNLSSTDVHPPLHHLVLWVTVRLFGDGELAVRLPSLVAGVALVPVLHRTAGVLFGRRAAWVAAVFATCSPFLVWYSQEARMYAVFMLLAALAILGQVQAVRRGAWSDWLLWAVSTGLLAWTQYFAVLPFLVAQAAFAWVAVERRRDRAVLRPYLRSWAAATAVVALVAAPLLPIVVGQLTGGGGGWFGPGASQAGLVQSAAGAGASGVEQAPSIYAAGANLIWGLWGYHSDATMARLVALWPLLMLLALVLLGRGRSRPALLLVGLVTIPMLGLMVVGFAKPGLFELRYFSGAIPALLLLAAYLVVTTTRRAGATVAVAALVAVSLLAGLADEQVNGANPRRYDFKTALDRVVAEAEPGDLVLYEPVYLASVVGYYAPDADAEALEEVDVASVPADRSIWIVAMQRSSSDATTQARVGEALQRSEGTRRVVQQFVRSNVEVWELRP